MRRHHLTFVLAHAIVYAGGDRRSDRPRQRNDGCACWPNHTSTRLLSERWPSPVASPLPVLLFLAGTEGSGHNFVEAILRATTGRATGRQAYFDGVLGTGAATFSCFLVDLQAASARENVSATYLRIRTTLQTHFESQFAANRDTLIVLGEDAYPCASHRRKWHNHPHYPDVELLRHGDGLDYHLRVLVLQREPERSVLSNLRRGFYRPSGADLHLAYRTVQKGTELISQMSASLRCDQVLVLPHVMLAFGNVAQVSNVLGAFLYLTSRQISSIASGIEFARSRYDTAMVICRICGNTSTRYSAGNVSRYFSSSVKTAVQRYFSQQPRSRIYPYHACGLGQV